ncbi:MAG: hypothetical protein AAGG08_18150 [Actinomycetota bacterium]
MTRSVLRAALTAATLAIAAPTIAGCSDASGGGSATSTPATSAPLLNSERIELTFGSYGIEVLNQSDSERISDLYSGMGDDRTTRTFAVVAYPSTIDDALADEHATIVGGGSIGSTFRDAGWTIDKIDTYVGELPAADVPARAFELMRIEPDDLAMHVYRFDVSRDGDPIEYATIVELHHPDYLTAGQLVDIFGESPSDAPDVALIADIARAAQF